MGSSKKVTVGHRYKMGLHFALARTADSLDEIIVGERSAWTGTLLDNQSFAIYAWELFGGDKREGGIEGSAQIMFGGAEQDQNAYLVAKLGALIPAYRGVVSLVFNGGRVCANNPYIKPWWFRVTRIFAQGDGSEQWYAAKAGVPGTIGVTTSALPFTLTWNQASYHPNGDDRAGMGVQFLDDTGVIEITSYYAPIIATLPELTWTERTLSGTVPAGTAVIRVWQMMDRFTGSNNDGYIDNIELNVSGALMPLVNPGAETGTTAGWTNYVGGLGTRNGGPSPMPGSLWYFDGGISLHTQAYQDIVSPETPIGMNPAHILRECLTDPYMRMNYPASMIDDASFAAAADLFYAEGMGLNFFWSNQTTVKEFIQTVLDHCGAVYYADPFTGKFVLTPIRGDYDPDELPVFDEASIISVDSFERGGAGEVVNEISVTYTDSATGRDAVVTVQDLASVYSQGAVIGQTRPYPGIGQAALAARVAQRDLTASTASTARLSVRFTRAAATLRPGGVIKLSWAKLGLSELICRVLDVSYGGLNNGEIRAQLCEDVFGLPDASYQVEQPGGWEPPSTAPIPVGVQHVLEGTYWDVYREADTADFAALSDDSGFVYTLAEAGDASQFGYSIYSRIDPDAYTLATDGMGFAPRVALSVAVERDDTTITVTGDGTGDFLTNIDIGDRLLLPGGATEEQMEVTDLTDIGSGVIGVNRAVLDTTPQVFAIGTDVWLLEYNEEDFGRDGVERFAGDTVDYKLISTSGGGDSSLVAATEISLTYDARIFRPYPPGNVEINGDPFPTTVAGAFTVTWSHRDRTQQTASFIAQDEASIGPEALTTYNLYFYDGVTLKHSAIGITGATYTVPNVVGTFDGRLEIESKRAGVVSWQRQVREFAFTGSVSPSGTYLISGGVVTLVTGTTYHVTAATYVIAGVNYASPAADLVLGAAHPTLNRIDVIAGNTSNVAVAIAGTPADVPSKPAVSATECEFAPVAIEAESYGIPPHSHNAADVVYDNASSGLEADNVQDAIDELAHGVMGVTFTNGDNTLVVPVNDVDVPIPQACTITGYYLTTTGGPGSCVIDIWRDTYANWPPVVGDSICASAKPTLTADQTVHVTTLTGWNVACASGDVLRFHLESSTAFNSIELMLTTKG